jgi:hypothetical protein
MPVAEARVMRGRPGPERGLEIALTIRGDQMGHPLMLNGIAVSLMSGANSVASTGSVESFGVLGFSYALMTATRSASATLFFPMSGESLRFIETRQNRDAVPFTVRVRLQAQHVLAEAPQHGLEGWTLSPQVWLQEIVASTEVPLSEWVRRLGEMGWTEISLFEVPILPLVGDPNLSVALDRLRDAETRLRGGDYKGVLTKCRDAFESAARYEAAGDTKRGFDALLERAERGDARKRAPLNAIILALSDFAHQLARHEQYPEIGVSRSEADLCYASTVAIFSLLGRRMSGVES